MTFLTTIISPANIAAMCDLARSAPKGDFAEVGVYQGGSASYLYAIAQEQKRRLHLFDTFSGTPHWREGLDKHKPGEFSDGINLEAIRASMPKAILYVGTYPNTQPISLPPIAFIHCDCDQYGSYKAVIDNLWPLVVSGGILLFDDYPYLEGAKRAVEEIWRPEELLKTKPGRYYVVKA